MRAPLLPVRKQEEKRGGEERQGSRTKLGSEQQNTVSVVYGCRLGTNSGFSVKLSHSSQASDWALNTAFVLSHHKWHWEAKSSNTWPLAASLTHAVRRTTLVCTEKTYGVYFVNQLWYGNGIELLKVMFFPSKTVTNLVLSCLIFKAGYAA